MKSPAWMSTKLDKGLIECKACNHRCKIPKGKTGICGIRKNEDGQLMLLVYGKSVAAHTDPVEKKPLYHFMPGTKIFSIGTVGCNFRCLFCQNFDISQYHKDHSEEEIVNAGMDMMPEDIVDICKKEKIPSIAFTYNEPAIFFEYAYDTAKLAHENNLKTVYVSNGFETREAIEKILPYLDAANIDLKSYANEFYTKICGGSIDPVKENIKWLWDKGIWVEVTTLVVTGENDSDEELTKIAEFLASISPDLPWHISRFFPCYKMQDKTPTPTERLEKAYEIGKKAGLKYVYVGNIRLPDKENTACPKCGNSVVKRSGYSILNKIGKGGKCDECGEEIAGRFN